MLYALGMFSKQKDWNFRSSTCDPRTDAIVPSVGHVDKRNGNVIFGVNFDGWEIFSYQQSTAMAFGVRW
jgi:hypothetical protein